jgi:hypothetical protein
MGNPESTAALATDDPDNATHTVCNVKRNKINGFMSIQNWVMDKLTDLSFECIDIYATHHIY